jgi:hypothetical protein
MLRVKKRMLAAATAAAWSSAALASSSGTADINAALFGLRESAIGVHLSPSGNQVAYVTPARGGEAIAFIANVKSGDTKPFLRSGKGPDKLRWCGFATEQRLVCRYTAIINDSGILVPFSRLVAVNSDGSGMKELGQSQSFYDAGYRQYDGEIIDWLPAAGGSVLMERSYVPEEGRGATRMVRGSAGLGVDRVDTNTSKVSVVEGARRDASFYLSDGVGNVRVMGAAGTQNAANSAEMLTGKTRYYYRPTGTHDWRTLIDYVSDEDVVALAVDPVSNVLYLLKPLNGRKALYRIKLDGSGATELVASHPQVDIDGVVRSANGQKVIGYTYAVDRRQVEYFDPEYKALASALAKAP